MEPLNKNDIDYLVKYLQVKLNCYKKMRQLDEKMELDKEYIESLILRLRTQELLQLI